jgi:hypothetical protein
MKELGKCSTFGGPHDMGVTSSEGLALYDHEDVAHYPHLFLPTQPHNTTGVARRLNPGAYYLAHRWQYEKTSREYLRSIKVKVTNGAGESVFAHPVDWGPNEHTGRIVDLSPGIFRVLQLKTDDIVTIDIPMPDEDTDQS